MKSDNTIRNYSAIDIEKYHKGLLSPKEMHDLEKAALDDLFLADALEGYAMPGVNAAADIADLKKRLANRTEENKVGSFDSPMKRTYLWWRIAAMFILVGGAGILIYQISTNDNLAGKSNQVANAPVPDSNSKSVITDSLVTGNSTSVATNGIIEASPKSTGDSTTFLNGFANGLALKTSTDSVSIAMQKINDDAKSNFTITPTDEKDKKDEAEAKELMAIELRKQSASGQRDVAAKKAETQPSRREFLNDSLASASASQYDNSRLYKQRASSPMLDNEKVANMGVTNQTSVNLFRGQVTDANNNALPFANITNTLDHVGTYTDAKGNFTLISPDSVLNVQIRSLGFTDNNIQLQNQVTNNRVVMQEDRSSLAEVVISNKRPNSATRSRTSTMVLDEPEPVDGWVNYDVYLANNLVVPETFRGRQTTSGEVQLSFEVNSKGEPVNITVVKSLCDSCDKEAIRLVKEGPKWKRKSRKGRTSVTVTF